MAVLANQRTVLVRRKSGVAFWAWVISIAAHLLALAVFGFVKFSQPRAQFSERPTPAAKVSQIKKLMQTAAIIPKPKIKSSSIKHVTAKQESKYEISEVFSTLKPGSLDLQDLTRSKNSRDEILISSGTISPKGIEFFGSWTNERKVCYVVDCSGSMKGILGRVQRQLKSSVASLEPDQYFYIIFFGSDRLFEFGDGHLVRATKQSKSASYSFIDLVEPVGQTNAMAALERAVQIRDSRGLSPSVIYFLTDGFELAGEDTHRFLQKVENLLERSAPATLINTIGFWPQDDDREMLKAIAAQTGGKFIFVKD